MDKILEVKKLKISFRTNNGTVKAVRDISFDLERGETLAIVGESGSGKSVTSKAILGISAGNAIIDGGEILYDGKDLLKISEEDMYKLRGDKIAMIFQDPLSSLNPIVKIGKQITEAMILKNRDSRKNARNEFNRLLKVLKEHIVKANSDKDPSDIAKLTKEFDDFNIVAIKIENSYNVSLVASNELKGLIEDFLFMHEKKQKLNHNEVIKGFLGKLKKIKDPYLTYNFKEELDNHSANLISLKKDDNFDELAKEAKALNEVLEKMISSPRPNFFRIGYYSYKNPNEQLYDKPIEEVNAMTLDYLNEQFMNQFLQYSLSGVKSSYDDALAGKKEVLAGLDDFEKYFTLNEFEKKDAIQKAKEFKVLVDKSIDYLDIVKDSVAYTFINSIISNIKTYFRNKISNEKEEKRFARQTARRDRLVNRGKQIDWKVVPKKIVPLQDAIDNIVTDIQRLRDKYNNDVLNSDSVNFDEKNLALIDHFKEKASEVVYRVTRAIAKERAIKLMEEVGIPEPRIRYYQYPFEFSGGMRQRIVIAIALSANPDILICDEPTTALDVTIQSQILELINKLKAERHLSVIFITHDLGVVANMADRIAVMYAGKIVEYGTSEEIFYSPAHPYTWALLSSMPDLDTKEKLEAIPGTPPNMIYPPVGDAFAARNKYALKIDFEEQPPLFKITDTHYAATWLLHPDAPKVEMPKIITERINRMKKTNEGGKE